MQDKLLIKKSTKKNVYDVIPEVKNIVSILVDNIYNDDTYQKYLKKLEKSTEDERKRAKIIKKTFTEIKVYGSKTEPLFLARDIGILMGKSHINAMVKKYDDNEKISGYVRTHKGKIKEMYFLTRFGVYRTFLTSRSKLSKVFRNFIYKLLDHMILFENAKLKELIKEFKNEHPGMIKESLEELNENYIKFKELYEVERKERLLWEKKAEEEHIQKLEIEEQRDELDIVNIYKEMYIEKINQKAKDYSYQLKNLRAESQIRSYNDMNNNELQILKKKFAKEIQIYIITPKYLTKVISKNDSIFKDKFVEIYTKNYKNMILPDSEYKIEFDEILFFRITFGKKINKTNYLHIITEWVPDRDSFNKLQITLKEESEWFHPVGKLNELIFKTNLENIKLNIHELFIQENNS